MLKVKGTVCIDVDVMPDGKVFPMCEVGRLLARLAKVTYFTQSDINILKSLGYELCPLEVTL